jgi:hypothetical protein
MTSTDRCPCGPSRATVRRFGGRSMAVTLRRSATAGHHRPNIRRTTVKRSRRVLSLAVASAIGATSLVGFAPRAEASTTVARFYSLPNQFGAVRTYVHPSNGYVCTFTTSDTDLAVNTSTLFSGFDNVISSFQAGGAPNCAVKLFDNNNWTGASFGYSVGASSLPSSIDNKTSSALIS